MVDNSLKHAIYNNVHKSLGTRCIRWDGGRSQTGSNKLVVLPQYIYGRTLLRQITVMQLQLIG